MESVFGKSDDIVLHAVVPFEFGFEAGGRADVVQFKHYLDGTVYATCDLMCREEQVTNKLGVYELAICHRSDEDWGAAVVSALAYYTLDAQLQPGHTLDLGPSAPKASAVSAFLFDELVSFEISGRPAGVLVCIGITTDELSACRQGRRDAVLKGLKSNGIYPFTDLGRGSVLGG